MSRRGYSRKGDDAISLRGREWALFKTTLSLIPLKVDTNL